MQRSTSRFRFSFDQLLDVDAIWNCNRSAVLLWITVLYDRPLWSTLSWFKGQLDRPLAHLNAVTDNLRLTGLGIHVSVSSLCLAKPSVTRNYSIAFSIVRFEVVVWHAYTHVKVFEVHVTPYTAVQKYANTCHFHGIYMYLCVWRIFFILHDVYWWNSFLGRHNIKLLKFFNPL